MKSTMLYVIIGIGALSAIVIPIFFVPVLLQQITYFPEDDPCAIASCAEQIIANCQPSHISFSSGGALASSLKVNVTGWDAEGNCRLGMQVEPGELTLRPQPYYLCSIPKDELQNWNFSPINTYAGLEDLEKFRAFCELRDA